MFKSLNLQKKKKTQISLQAFSQDYFDPVRQMHLCAWRTCLQKLKHI